MRNRTSSNLHVSNTCFLYNSDLSCLHGIICYACQVMHNKIMPCKPPFILRNNFQVVTERKIYMESLVCPIKKLHVTSSVINPTCRIPLYVDVSVISQTFQKLSLNIFNIFWFFCGINQYKLNLIIINSDVLFPWYIIKLLSVCSTLL